MQSCIALRAARVTEILSASIMLQQQEKKSRDCSLMSILLEACHGSLQPQLKSQQRGNSLLIVCKFNSTCRDGVKEEPVKPREVSVYLRGKICVSGRHQQDSYTNSSNGAGHCHPSNIPWLLAVLSAVSWSMFPPALFFLSCFRPILSACSGAGSLGACMVKVSRYHAAAGNSLPGRELYPRAPHQPGRIQHPVWVSAQFSANSQPCRMEETDTSEGTHQGNYTSRKGPHGWGSDQEKSSFAIALLTAHKIASCNREATTQEEQALHC